MWFLVPTYGWFVPVLGRLCHVSNRRQHLNQLANLLTHSNSSLSVNRTCSSRYVIDRKYRRHKQDLERWHSFRHRIVPRSLVRTLASSNPRLKLIYFYKLT